MDTKKVSIVMAAFNRKTQLLFTLKSISYSSHKNIEIIIVDDASDEGNRLSKDILLNTEYYEFIKDLDIKVIRVEPHEKTWTNPSVPYNMGFRAATGDIIILQNPENCHVGDCVSFALEYLHEGDYMVLNCFGIGSFERNNHLHSIYKNQDDAVHARDFINSINTNGIKYGKTGIIRNDVEGFLMYPEGKEYVPYHYFSAIHKKDLVEKMDGGFCEEFKDGVCLEDDDFIARLYKNKLNIISTRFNDISPFVIHQYHNPSIELSDFPRLHSINKKIYYRRLNEFGFEHDVQHVRPYLIQ